MNQSGSRPQEYLRSAVLTASPEQLQLMLYDGAIRFALQGLDALKAADREAAFNALDRAQQIVIELTNGLNRSANPELADQMVALHNFIFRRLVKANVDADLGALEEALRILRHQRETWQLVIERVSALRGGGGAESAPVAGTTRSSPGRLVAGAVSGPAARDIPVVAHEHESTPGLGLHLGA